MKWSFGLPPSLLPPQLSTWFMNDPKSQLVIFGSESVQDVWGVFDDNSQNNIMSDIDKHHGDSYSCPEAQKPFNRGQTPILTRGVVTNHLFLDL